MRKSKFSPTPIAKILKEFDSGKSVSDISHISEYAANEKLFISQQKAYFEFCDFIKINSKKICGESSKPYELEMLLFTLADTEIFEDLKDKIKITTANLGCV